MSERKKEEPKEDPVEKVRSIFNRGEKITKEELESLGWQRATVENPPGDDHRFRYGAFILFWNQSTGKIRKIYKAL